MTLSLHALVMLHATRKQAYVRYVSRGLWVEAAAWRMKASALKPWSWRVFRWGFRITTPVLGFSVGVWI